MTDEALNALWARIVETSDKNTLILLAELFSVLSAKLLDKAGPLNIDRQLPLPGDYT